MQVADHPHLTERDRKRAHKALARLADVEGAAPAALDLEQDEDVIRGMGIGVRRGDD